MSCPCCLELLMEFARLRTTIEVLTGQNLDAATLEAIGRHFSENTGLFTAQEVTQQARHGRSARARELRAVLAAQGALTPRTCGKLLSRLEGRELRGYLLSFVKKEPGGRLWSVERIGFLPVSPDSDAHRHEPSTAPPPAGSS